MHPSYAHAHLARGISPEIMSSRESRPAKENILDLAKFMDSPIHVELSGQRKGNTDHDYIYIVLVAGILKGYDKLSNLVLDQAVEYLSSENEPESLLPGRKRNLGLLVIKGTQIVMLSPADHIQEISNPFI